MLIDEWMCACVVETNTLLAAGAFSCNWDVGFSKSPVGWMNLNNPESTIQKGFSPVQHRDKAVHDPVLATLSAFCAYDISRSSGPVRLLPADTS